MTPKADANAIRETSANRMHVAVTSRVRAKAFSVSTIDEVVPFGWMFVLVMAAVMTFASGSFAAEKANADGRVGKSALAGDGISSPIDLSGRWAGRRSGFGVRLDADGCDAKGCTLTYDIAACDAGWCGVIVASDGTCGQARMTLAQEKSNKGETITQRDRFMGRLELSSKADAYVVEAFYQPGKIAPDLTPDQPNASGGVKTKLLPRLSMIGDTGTELMMFRRSFPFSATLTYQGPASCALDHPTS